MVNGTASEGQTRVRREVPQVSILLVEAVGKLEPAGLPWTLKILSSLLLFTLFLPGI
jgi:hypothetical protein